MSFEELKLHPALLETVHQEGYESPTPIQTQAIPSVLAGRDLLGCAQTGTGKTAAFALPILHRLAAAPKRSREPRVLVLVPTRELASQVGDSFTTYGRRLGVRCAVIFGGVGQGSQVSALRAGVDVLVATPGRLLDLFDQEHLELRSVEVLVLDEADRMLDMGFVKPIREILAELPKQRQNLLFSATMPAAIRALADGVLRDPARVSVTPVASTAPLIEQEVCFVRQADKPDALARVLGQPEVERAIVFTRTKHGADKLAKKLGRVSIGAEVIHGNKSQNARLRALANFRDGRVRVLVATDVMARGIDVDGISHVVNYDVPNDPESYVHRIGRTGRAGATGRALSFCDDAERTLLRDIERLTKKPMTILRDLPPAPVPTASSPENAPSGAATVRTAAVEATSPRTAPSRPGPLQSGAPRGGDPRKGSGRSRSDGPSRTEAAQAGARGRSRRRSRRSSLRPSSPAL